MDKEEQLLTEGKQLEVSNKIPISSSQENSAEFIIDQNEKKQFF